MDTAPHAASVAFYNELVALDPEAVERAGQIEWQLQREIVRERQDPRARIALTKALLVQGKASEARAQVDFVWDRRRQLDAEESQAFSAQLLGLGLYERSIEMADLHETPHSYDDGLRIVAAFSMGDLDGFAALASTPQLKIVDRMRGAGLADLFQQHQGAVRDTLSGRQVATELILVPASEGEGPTPTLAQMLYLAGSYAERTRLGDELYDRLAPVYEAAGKDLADAWSLYTPMLMDFRGRTPIPPE